jgi:hypothetical protein
MSNIAGDRDTLNFIPCKRESLKAHCLPSSFQCVIITVSQEIGRQGRKPATTCLRSGTIQFQELKPFLEETSKIIPLHHHYKFISAVIFLDYPFD